MDYSNENIVKYYNMIFIEGNYTKLFDKENIKDTFNIIMSDKFFIYSVIDKEIELTKFIDILKRVNLEVSSKLISHIPDNPHSNRILGLIFTERFFANKINSVKENFNLDVLNLIHNLNISKLTLLIYINTQRFVYDEKSTLTVYKFTKSIIENGDIKYSPIRFNSSDLITEDPYTLSVINN